MSAPDQVVLSNSGYFQVAFVNGQLCVQQNNGSREHPVRWLWVNAERDEVKPETMGKDDFVKQLVLMFDGGGVNYVC
jgi:hypothetical protein